MKWFKKSQSQNIISILTSIIHEAFTGVVDKIHGLGYMDEKQRIKLSHIIGDTLDFFKKKVETELKELKGKNIDEEKIVEITKK